MPDITITVTANQAQRIAAAFGPPPDGVTPSEWVVQNTKKFYKSVVQGFEAQAQSNTAYDAARAQVNVDFGGF